MTTIKIDTLNALQDAELRTVIEQSQGILKQRDDDRKAKAMEQARALLASVGLSMKDLNGKGKTKAAKGTVYHGGTTYRHPGNKELTWNGKGKHPGWLVALEAEGGKAVEVE
ncbi:MAG TPA: H-NS histone family protein [Bryobacteraceae bacterium]|jgi:DNA-binding protein H-NS|nr:H-NS histone family protein [Bryobacteraceae bacterium]